MKQRQRIWRRWWTPACLALLGLLLLMAFFWGHSSAGQADQSVEAPTAEQERLWAEIGLNDAWYVANGYTEAPPPSAPSPFWPSKSCERTDVSQTWGEAITDTPRLLLDPQTVTFHAYADEPQPLSATVEISNSGGGTLSWVAELAPGGSFSPTLVPTSGLQGESLTLIVDDVLFPEGSLTITHTRRISISAAPSDTLNSPQVLTASLYADPHLPRLWLDTNAVLFRATSPGVYSRTVQVRNTGGYTLAWGTQIFSSGLAPLVTPALGVQDGLITITVDARDYLTITAVYTGQVVVTATWGTALLYPVLDTPQKILVQLQMLSGLAYLPQVKKHEPLPPTPTPSPTPTPTPTALPELAEVRAIWVTRYDWTSAIFTEEPADVDEIVANVAGAGFNTIFFQVRAHGDAYYAPGLEPWSARLNDDGVLGQDPGWDPLARMIEQAQARGIQVHAYVNVYPAWRGETAPAQDTTPLHPFWTWSWLPHYDWADWRHWHQTDGFMKLNDRYLWASPGVDEVRDHVVAVASDIASRYAVDGIHLDLVRYLNRPYSYDPISNAAAGSAKTEARDQWQRERVSDLVGRVYAAIQGIRPGARLSAAVWFCYYADGCGYGLSSGFADYYQDSLGWLSAGVIDGIAPMLYEWQGFEDLAIWRDVMQQFQDANAGRHVYPGISGDFYSFSEIANRIQAARDAGTAGHAIFSYGAVDARGYWDDFAAGPYAQPAIVAPLPWR